MEDHENIYDKIKELLGSIPNQLSVLEEKIDIELQMEYFELSRRLKNSDSQEAAMEESFKLFESSASIEEKKCILARIATLNKVEAFRIIERFLNDSPGELKSWGVLALQENRMLLESQILNENQVFISTGLGGKGEKLRYFVAIFGKESMEFTELQKKIIRIEFEISLKKYKSNLEEINFSDSIATMLAIIPLRIIIKNMFTEAIDECNQYGNFLNTNFIISNVKAMSFEEIREYIKTQKRDK